MAAWSRDAAGVPRVVSARIDGSSLQEPDDAMFEAAAAAREPVDLGGPGVRGALQRIAVELGFSALCPVGATGEETILLLGDDREPPGRVRPRTLAALGSAAAFLAKPAAAALAASRLSIMDADIQRLDRLAALGSLVSEIVHEIRNPLVSVKTFLQLLPERVDEPDFRERFLQVATDELRRVERLLDLVLEHGRPAPPPRHDAGSDLSAAFASVVQLVGFRAAERGVSLEVAETNALPAARISEDALRQVVLNLVLNAIEVTPAGGDIRLDGLLTSDGLEVSVDDRGPGVPRELRERLFEPFVSSKGDRPGGLGLAITRRIVEEAGGHIRIEGREGGGSSFRVALLPR